MNIKKILIYSFNSIFIVIFDRFTKYHIINYLPRLYINSFLSIELVYNRGISWGLFHCLDHTIFAMVNTFIACIIMALIIHTIYRIKQAQNVFGETLIFAGAISNFYDRFVYQGVVDFILISYKNWHFPIFNIADMFIVVGVLYIISMEYQESCKK